MSSQGFSFQIGQQQVFLGTPVSISDPLPLNYIAMRKYYTGPSSQTRSSLYCPNTNTIQPGYYGAVKR